MSTTRYKIAQMVLELLKSGHPKTASTPRIENIIESVGQCINKLYKQEHYVNLQSGETTPEGAMLTYYDNLTPVQYKSVSKLTLPATPMALPRNGGIHHVSRTGDIDNGFIPVQNGQTALIKGEKLISDVLGQVTYTPYGNDIVFNQDLTTEEGIELIVGLVVMDINSFDDYTNLPLPADMEQDVVTTVFKIYSAQPQEQRLDDPSVERIAGKAPAGKS